MNYAYISKDESEALKHYGVLGMKWGVRRYQNKDGTYTQKGLQRLEKKAKKKEYKRGKKAGEHGYLFKSARTSTGKSYNKAVEEFGKQIANDKKYKQLSKKAFEAEKKKLLFEKPYYEKGQEDKLYSSKQYLKLDAQSRKATKAKENRVKEFANSYIDKIKDAKLDDMGVNKNRQEAKKFIDGIFDAHYWDGNLDYNPDNYYDSWVDKEKFKG